jgi:hypothetical protein
MSAAVKHGGPPLPSGQDGVSFGPPWWKKRVDCEGLVLSL